MTRCQVESARLPMYLALGWRVVYRGHSPRLGSDVAVIEHPDAPPPWPPDHATDRMRNA